MYHRGLIVTYTVPEVSGDLRHVTLLWDRLRTPIFTLEDLRVFWLEDLDARGFPIVKVLSAVACVFWEED